MSSRITLSAAASALLIAASMAQNALKAQPEEKERERLRWENFLKQAFKGMPQSVAADVDPSAPTPPAIAYPRSEPSAWAGLMGGLLARTPIVSPTTHVFVRRAGESGSTADGRRSVADWLGEADDEELRKLCGEGVAYADLSPKAQALFLRLCGNPGLRQKMAAGDFARATVRIRVFAKASDGAGRTKYLPTDAFARDSEVEERARERMEAARPVRKRAPVRLSEPSEGPLDFGEGRLIPLRQAVQEAGKTFSLRYQYDARLGDSMVFWRGRFTQNSFENSLREVTRTIEAKSLDAKARDVEQALENQMRTRIASLLDATYASKNIPVSDALQGRTMTSGELAPLVPDWQRSLEANGVPSNANFTLVPVLSLTLVASGSYRDPERPNESPFGNRWGIVFLP